MTSHAKSKYMSENIWKNIHTNVTLGLKQQEQTIYMHETVLPLAFREVPKSC